MSLKCEVINNSLIPCWRRLRAKKPDEEMEILYAASFRSGEKGIHVDCNVYGNLDMWLALIREGKVRTINAEDDLTEIREVFPVVQEILSGNWNIKS